MKKILLALMLGLSIVSFNACKNDSTPAPDATPDKLTGTVWTAKTVKDSVSYNAKLDFKSDTEFLFRIADVKEEYINASTGPYVYKKPNIELTIEDSTYKAVVAGRKLSMVFAGDTLVFDRK